MSLPTRIKLRRDTSAAWSNADPVLESGEIGVETDTRKIKIGNGISQWTLLQYAKPDISESAINELQDVSVVGAMVGDVLKFNGQQWVSGPSSSGTSITSIDDIQDVVISSPALGEVLQYDGSNWVNTEVSISVQQSQSIHPFGLLG